MRLGRSISLAQQLALSGSYHRIRCFFMPSCQSCQFSWKCRVLPEAIGSYATKVTVCFLWNKLPPVTRWRCLDRSKVPFFFSPCILSIVYKFHFDLQSHRIVVVFLLGWTKEKFMTRTFGCDLSEWWRRRRQCTVVDDDNKIQSPTFGRIN